MTMKLRISNPRYAAAGHSAVDVDLNLEDGRVLPFTASPNDPEPHGRQLYADLAEGKHGPIAPYTPPPPRAPIKKVTP